MSYTECLQLTWPLPGSLASTSLHGQNLSSRVKIQRNTYFIYLDMDINFPTSQPSVLARLNGVTVEILVPIHAQNLKQSPIPFPLHSLQLNPFVHMLNGAHPMHTERGPKNWWPSRFRKSFSAGDVLWCNEITTFVGKVTNTDIHWVVPPPSNSHHQDYEPFLVGIPINLHLPQESWEGGQPNIYTAFWHCFRSFCSKIIWRRATESLMPIDFSYWCHAEGVKTFRLKNAPCHNL